MGKIEESSIKKEIEDMAHRNCYTATMFFIFVISAFIAGFILGRIL